MHIRLTFVLEKTVQKFVFEFISIISIQKGKKEEHKEKYSLK